MDRNKNKYKLIAPLCVCVMLTGCYNKPGEIHTDFSYVDKVGDGQPIGSGNGGGIQWGDNGNLGGYTTLSNGEVVYFPPSDAEHNASVLQSVIASVAPPKSSTSIPTVSTPTPVEKPAEIDFDNAKSFTDAELLSYYGSQNARGYYSNDGSFYSKDLHCYGVNINMEYKDAVQAYISEYGQPTLSFKNYYGTYTYWFKGRYVYCLYDHKYYTVWSISEPKTTYGDGDGDGTPRTDWKDSNFNGSSILKDAFASFGSTYHMDYYNYIFSTPTGYVVIDRQSYCVNVI